MKRILATALLLLCISGRAEEPGALADFAPFVGAWQAGDSVQVLRWGPGRQSVHAVSYRQTGDSRRPVSEGLWYWHPGQSAIRGVFTAIEMPVSLFLYETRFDSDRLVAELTAVAPDGAESHYVEALEVLGPDRFR